MQSAVTISLVEEARRGPFVFHGDLEAGCREAAELGFDAIELFAPGPDAVHAVVLRRMLADFRLRLAAVGTGAGWLRNKLLLSNVDAGQRQSAIDFVKSMIDLAGPFGAPAIIGSMQGRIPDGDDPARIRGILADSLATLAEHARQYRVPLLYEPLNRYETNVACNVEQSLELLKLIGNDNVAILCDLFHMNIEEPDLSSALRLAGPKLGHVHFVDSNRRPAGNGHIAYPPIAAVLKEIGYRGFLSAEALPWPDSSSAAKQTILTYRKYFT